MHQANGIVSLSNGCVSIGLLGPLFVGNCLFDMQIKYPPMQHQCHHENVIYSDDILKIKACHLGQCKSNQVTG